MLSPYGKTQLIKNFPTWHHKTNNILNKITQQQKSNIANYIQSQRMSVCNEQNQTFVLSDTESTITKLTKNMKKIK